MNLPYSLVFILIVANVNVSYGFVHKIISSRSSTLSPNVLVGRNNANRAPNLQLNSFVDISSALIAVGDYAAEIERGVGEEIYAPIFKSGLVLFGSGLISAFMAAIIIAKSDSWEELGLEFERGKVAQLIELDVVAESTPPALTGITPTISGDNEIDAPEQPAKKVEKRKVALQSSSDGVYDMDL